MSFTAIHMNSNAYWLGFSFHWLCWWLHVAFIVGFTNERQLTLTLPEWEEDDALDGEELEDRVVRREQLFGGEVEQELKQEGQGHQRVGWGSQRMEEGELVLQLLNKHVSGVNMFFLFSATHWVSGALENILFKRQSSGLVRVNVRTLGHGCYTKYSVIVIQPYISNY